MSHTISIHMNLIHLINWHNTSIRIPHLSYFCFREALWFYLIWSDLVWFLLHKIRDPVFPYPSTGRVGGYLFSATLLIEPFYARLYVFDITSGWLSVYLFIYLSALLCFALLCFVLRRWLHHIIADAFALNSRVGLFGCCCLCMGWMFMYGGWCWCCLYMHSLHFTHSSMLLAS